MIVADCGPQGNGGNLLKWARILTTPAKLFAQPLTEILLLAGNPVCLDAELLALKLIVGKIVCKIFVVNLSSWVVLTMDLGRHA